MEIPSLPLVQAGPAPKLDLPDVERPETRTLIWDIETSALIAYAHEVWNINLRRNAIIEKPEMVCFGAKWRNDNGVQFYSIPEVGYEAMVSQAWTLLDQAEQVVSFNGVRFDTKRANNEFARLGLGPPSDYKEIDLFRAAKKRFDFLFKGLDDIALELGLGRKGKIDDRYGTMRKFVDGEPEAISEVRGYNVQDVLLTEQVYEELKGWL